jgi:hypothetical protein
VADHRDEAEPVVGHVDVAILALGWAVDSAHVVRKHAPRLDAPDDVNAHVAVKGRPDVVRPHRGRDPDCGRLVAAPRVEAAGELSLLVEDVSALLHASREEEVAVDPEQVLAREARFPDLVERADGLGFSGYCHLYPPGDSFQLYLGG